MADFKVPKIPPLPKKPDFIKQLSSKPHRKPRSGMRFTKLEAAMFVVGILLTLPGLCNLDPVVFFPCMVLSWITFLYICIAHAGPIWARVVVAFAITSILFFVSIRSYSHNKVTISAVLPAAPSPTPSEEKIPTLHDLFVTDFERFLSLGVQPEVERLVDKTKMKIEFRVHLDFLSKSKFTSAYIPACPMTYDICVKVAMQHQELLNLAEGGLVVNSLDPADATEERSKDLTFTGKVFIYHEMPMTLQQLGDLEKSYQEKGLTVQFRGLSYASTRDLQHKATPKRP